MLDALLADGTIHTAAGDQASEWRPPTLAERDLDGSWDLVLSGVSPSFSLRDVHSDSGSDGDSAASGAGGAMQIVTANGTFSYTEDWNRIERHVAQLSLRQTSCITLNNAPTPPTGGPCAGRPTQSHLSAARSILTPAKRTS